MQIPLPPANVRLLKNSLTFTGNDIFHVQRTTGMVVVEDFYDGAGLFEAYLLPPFAIWRKEAVAGWDAKHKRMMTSRAKYFIVELFDSNSDYSYGKVGSIIEFVSDGRGKASTRKFFTYAKDWIRYMTQRVSLDGQLRWHFYQKEAVDEMRRIQEARLRAQEDRKANLSVESDMLKVLSTLLADLPSTYSKSIEEDVQGKPEGYIHTDLYTVTLTIRRRPRDLYNEDESKRLIIR